MKKLFLVLYFLSAGAVAAAERQMILAGDIEFGGFGGPLFRYTNIYDHNKVLVGGYGALLINHTVYIGGGGYGTARDIGDGYSSYSGGGVVAGMFLFPHKALHMYVETGLWSGNLSGGGAHHMMASRSTEDFLIVEPTIGAAVNIMQHIKALLGISYKFIGYLDDPELTERDVGGVSINASIVFGSF